MRIQTCVMRFVSLIAFGVLLLSVASSCGSGKKAAISSKPGASERNEVSVFGTGIAVPVKQGLESGIANLHEYSAELTPNLLHGDFSLVALTEGQQREPRLNRFYRMDVTETSTETVVKIVVEGVLDMKFALFELNYDPSGLTPVEVEIGDFLGSKDETLSLFTSTLPGIVPVGIARLNYAMKRGADGGGWLATIRFSKKPFGVERITSKVPVEDGNKVSLTSGAGQGTTGRFTEKNIGDYDNNGVVGVADITPIAIHYLKPASDSVGAQNADGDGDGSVGIPDITPIAIHYLNQISSYKIYKIESVTQPSPEDFVSAPVFETLNRPTGLTNSDTKPVYSFNDPSAGPNSYYTAVPYDSESNAGIRSNVLKGQIPGSAPVVTITSPSSGAEVNGVVTIAASVTSSVGIEKVEFFVNGGSIGEDTALPYSADWDTTALAEGLYVLTAVATDEYSRTGTSPEMNVSKVFFTLGIDPPTGSAFSGGTVTITATTDYPGTLDVKFFIDDAEVGSDNSPPYSYDWDAESASVGPHIFRIDATDEEMNLKQVSATYTRLDTSPVLPPEWQQAKNLLGLNDATMGPGGDIFGFTPGTEPNSWTWTEYADLYTMFDIYWNAWFAEPEEFPVVMRDMGNSLGGAQGLQDLLLAATDETLPAHRISRQNHSETLDPEYPLAQAVADFVTASGGTPDLPSYRTALQPMSLANQNALAPVIYASRDALELRNTTLADIGFTSESLDVHFSHSFGAWLSHEFWIPTVYSSESFYMRGFPYADAFFTGAALITSAIDDFTAYMRTNPTWESVTLDVVTPAGNVTIGGTSNDTYNAPAHGNGHAILIDLGGDDTYNCHAGGTASSANGIAVCLDLGGNDTYNRIDDPFDIVRNPEGGVYPDDDTCQQGAARYGVGILVDYGGNDAYNSVRMSQGAAVFGVGILADYFEGNDTYTMEALGQGAAIGGVGIHFDDGGGTNEYRMVSRGQGFGGIMGIGCLVNSGFSNDIYFAEPDYDSRMPEYQSPQLPPDHPTDPSFTSFCQGAGFGLRWGAAVDQADGETQLVAAGGLGLLFDNGGNDTYTCGVFGQGVGFYQATGILIDLSGNDVRSGKWYTNGATAHVAVAGLWDGAGDDNYYNKFSVGIGGAHDWSVTWFLDRSGHDYYDGSNLTLGAGNANAFGYFIDIHGDDTYMAHDGGGENLTLGRGVFGGETREDQVTYGIFIDTSGADFYDSKYANMLAGIDDTTIIDPAPGDGYTWMRANYPTTGTNYYQLEFGIGIDSPVTP